MAVGGGLTTKHLWVGTSGLFDGRRNTVTQIIWLVMVIIIIMMMMVIVMMKLVELGHNERPFFVTNLGQSGIRSQIKN